MATTSKARPAPEAEAQGESKPKSTKVRASDVQAQVFQAIRAAGPEGITLKALGDATGLRYRVLHNVTWALETKTETVHRVGEGRRVVYAANEPKPARKARARKSPAKATKAA
jgi:hypothetical protein